MNWEARSQRAGVWDACGSIPLAATRGQPWTPIGTSLQAVLRTPVARRGHLAGMLGEAGRQWQLGPGSWLWGSLGAPLQEAAPGVKQQGSRGNAMPGKLIVARWP